MKVPLPERLEGTRCLDVGMGGWAAELERRGAAEVVTLGPDLDDLDPVRVGHFDVVVCGGLLGGLRDPVLALERARSVCAGIAVIDERVELLTTLRHPRRAVARLDGDRGTWWQPNRAALLRMIQSAGFTVEEASGVFFVPAGDERPARRRALVRRIGTPRGREALVAAVTGVPHVAVRARPA